MKLFHAPHVVSGNEHLRPKVAKTWNLGLDASITLEDGKARVRFGHSGGSVTKEELDKTIETLMFVSQEMDQ